MDCVVFVAPKAASVPIQSCGGIILKQGEELVVRKEIALSMAPSYRGYLIQVGEEQRPKLGGGHYEVRSARPVKAPALEPERESPLESRATDKSLKGKSVLKKK